MFETSQQEQGSGSGKVVAGVIAVVVVLLVAVYFIFLRGQEGTAPGGANPAAAQSAAAAGPADPMKDLKIVKSTLRRDQTQTMAMWDIQVENRAKGFAYKDLQYATNYYNAQDAVIYHNEGTLADPVDPADQHTYSNINDGLYPVGTVRYTMELKGATPVGP
jgi:hypothetical protein